MPEKISIVKESGETISSNIVSVFTIPDTEKKYIITTENAVDPHGLTVLHVSEIVDGELKKVATDEEWSSIKTIMRAIISGNVGSYKYLPAVELLKAEGQYSRDISVSASASKQMIDNYNAADLSAEGGSEEAPAGEAGADPSIFPGGNEGPVDDEVIPGIQEVTEDNGANEQNNPPVEEVAPPAATAAPAEPIQDIAQPVAPPPEAIPSAPAPTVVPPAPAAPAAPDVIPSVTTPEVVQAAPAAPEVIPPAAVPMTPPPVPTPVEAPGVVADQLQETQTLTDDVQVPNIETMTAQLPQVPLQVPVSTVAQPMPMPEMQPAVMAPVVPDPAAPVENVPSISVAPELTPMPVQEVATATTVAQPVVVNTMPEAAQMVQVAQPTQVVPTAQIAQGIPEPTVVAPIKVDDNVTPSFKPDATLDEVVKGAQDMFMEGVKNLVQTIQEKVYRDLYTKEAEMKKREALVAQKEQMLNTQFATMMSNITANFNGVPQDASNANPQG